MHHTLVRFGVLFAGAALLAGLGCQTAKPPEGQNVKPPGPSALAPTMGFGKLPKIAPSEAKQTTALATDTVRGGSLAPTVPENPESASANARAMMLAPGYAPPDAPSTIAKPIPPPPPNPRPVTVEYLLEGPLPEWGTADDVLLAKRQLPDSGAVRTFVSQAGLPGALTGGITTVNAATLQWKDADAFTWTYDSANKSVSFWKELQSQKEQRNGQPAFDEARVKQSADAFLDAHGFSDIRARGGNVLDVPQYLPLQKGTDDRRELMPCIQEGVAVGSTGAGQSGGGSTGAAPAPEIGIPTKPLDATVVSPTIYPSPCWWPVQATVAYPGIRDGKKIADAYGNSINAGSIAVDVQTMQTANGFLQPEQGVERSSYPLIDQETAKRRLQSGARNPVWPWGNETGTIIVRLKTIELVWMQYDVWGDGTNDTYYLPALRATGSVERMKDTPPENYSTILPLLADDVFEDVAPPLPEPMPLRGESAPASR